MSSQTIVTGLETFSFGISKSLELRNVHAYSGSYNRSHSSHSSHIHIFNIVYMVCLHINRDSLHSLYSLQILFCQLICTILTCLEKLFCGAFSGVKGEVHTFSVFSGQIMLAIVSRNALFLRILVQF